MKSPKTSYQQVMPKILTITFIHAFLLGLGGWLLGMMVLSTGFSDSEVIKEGHIWLFKLWQILNAPASYLTYYSETTSWLWVPVQLITSFAWSNIYVLIWSALKRHNKSVKQTD